LQFRTHHHADARQERPAVFSIPLPPLGRADEVIE
jgi:hypothetical protein